MAITILLRTYYNLRLLFFYIWIETLIFAKSIETDFVKKYRIYENNELFSDSHFVCACHRFGVGALAQCGSASYIVITVGGGISNSRCNQPFRLFRTERPENVPAPRFPIEG